MKLPKTFTVNDECINVVVESPKGTSNKYTYQPEQDYFKLTKVLPAGLSFPYDFGFIPGTKADDGDAFDALVLMQEPSFTGCVIECRVVGVMKAVQTVNGEKQRNDRIIAVPIIEQGYSYIKSIADISKKTLEELGGFFTYYNQLKGKKFEVIGYAGIDTAIKLLQAQIAT